MLQYSIIIIAVGLLGGMLPLLVRRSDRLLHLFIAFATGLFLSAVFLHLLPEVARMAASVPSEHGEGEADHTLWLFVLLGVVGLFLLENLVLAKGGPGSRHLTVGWASLFGLCVHAFTAGLGLAAAHVKPELAEPVFLSIVSHKMAETFSLAAVFMLAGARGSKILVLVLLFSLVTPAGAIVGGELVHVLSSRGLHILTALAAGTFLFVALCDLLPEVFHHREDLWSRIGFLAAGIALSVVLHGHEGAAVRFIWEVLVETAVLVCDTAPFLLVGFFLAGLLKVFIPTSFIYRHLGRDDFMSVLRSSLYGVPVPLCSCSVIPTATSLRQAGASKGATASFLISTPETGVDSISVTYALLDPLMTVIRPVVAFVTAVTTGTCVNLFARGAPSVSDAPIAPAVAPATCEMGAACCNATPDAIPEDTKAVKPPLLDRLREALRYAYGTLFDDLTRVILIGFLVSGLIATAVPDELFASHLSSNWMAMGLMIVLGTPLYICATASTPVAATLIAKGLDPGAALVFLLVGPATNVTTLLVVTRLLGKKTLLIYLACITGVAVAAGTFTSWLYSALDVDLSSIVAASLEERPGPVQIVGGVIFAILLALSAWRIGLGASLFKVGARTDDTGVGPPPRLT